MLRALYTGASGMSAQEMNLENVANNLANSSTAGFRKRWLQFEDLIYQNVVMPGAASTQQVGAIQLALFQNPGGLNSVGNNLFLATTASGDPIVGTPGGSEGEGTIQQGYLEQSNVDVVEEFVQMIVAQRSYEASSRVVQAANEMFQNVNGLGR